LGLERRSHDTSGHGLEEDRGAAGIERRIHSGYEGAYTRGTRAVVLFISLPFLPCLHAHAVDMLHSYIYSTMPDRTFGRDHSFGHSLKILVSHFHAFATQHQFHFTAVFISIATASFSRQGLSFGTSRRQICQD